MSMEPPSSVVAAAVLLTLLSGCVGDPLREKVDAPSVAVPPLLFAMSPPAPVDRLRSGGEPVIVALSDGSLVVAGHPGSTLAEAEPNGIAGAASLQNHVWRSSDGANTWQYVAGAAGNPLVRQQAVGPSDPDLAYAGGSRLYLTDLTLAGISVSRSDDGGVTWTGGSPLAGIIGDRPWLAAWGDSVWMSASRTVWHSSDAGETWAQVGASNAAGDIRADRRGILFAGAGPGVDVSRDGGRTWSSTRIPNHTADAFSPPFTEPAIDLAGNLFIAWMEGGGIWFAASTDEGRTWLAPIRLDEYFEELREGVNLWPWVSAGSEGRVAITWYGAADADHPRDEDNSWRLYSIILTNGATAGPPDDSEVFRFSSPFVVHEGSICWGTECAASKGDRRLGDFFETAVAPDGRLHIIFAMTTEGDAVAHPWHTAQTEGPPLVLEADIASGASSLIGAG